MLESPTNQPTSSESKFVGVERLRDLSKWQDTIRIHVNDLICVFQWHRMACGSAMASPTDHAAVAGFNKNDVFITPWARSSSEGLQEAENILVWCKGPLNTFGTYQRRRQFTSTTVLRHYRRHLLAQCRQAIFSDILVQPKSNRAWRAHGVIVRAEKSSGRPSSFLQPSGCQPVGSTASEQLTMIATH